MKKSAKSTVKRKPAKASAPATKMSHGQQTVGSGDWIGSGVLLGSFFCSEDCVLNMGKVIQIQRLWKEPSLFSVYHVADGKLFMTGINQSEFSALQRGLRIQSARPGR